MKGQVGNRWYLSDEHKPKPKKRKSPTNPQSCPICNSTYTVGGPGRKTVDHFWPRRFGRFMLNNWKICGRCNSAKGSRFPNSRETILFSNIHGFCKK